MDEILQNNVHAYVGMLGRPTVSAKRTPRAPPWLRGGERPARMGFGLLWAFRGIVFGSGGGRGFEDEKDGPADLEVFVCWRLSTGPSDCQSMPCCFLS